MRSDVSAAPDPEKLHRGHMHAAVEPAYHRDHVRDRSFTRRRSENSRMHLAVACDQTLLPCRGGHVANAAPLLRSRAEPPNNRFCRVYTAPVGIQRVERVRCLTDNNGVRHQLVACELDSLVLVAFEPAAWRIRRRRRPPIWNRPYERRGLEGPRGGPAGLVPAPEWGLLGVFQRTSPSRLRELPLGLAPRLVCFHGATGTNEEVLECEGGVCVQTNHLAVEERVPADTRAQRGKGPTPAQACEPRPRGGQVGRPPPLDRTSR